MDPSKVSKTLPTETGHYGFRGWDRDDRADAEQYHVSVPPRTMMWHVIGLPGGSVVYMCGGKLLRPETEEWWGQWERVADPSWVTGGNC